ncbi:MAG TPA: hypothetical protein VEZ14_04825 [Dehalococcoidia bacterium]|nr:hypothetical protein [Dehalococcoidia bacterium]
MVGSPPTAMRPGERLIRSDPVILTHTSTTGLWPNPPRDDGGFLAVHRTIMALTTERLVFLPLRALWIERPTELLQYVPVIGSAFTLLRALLVPYPALRRPLRFELRAIDRFWTWHPEFSGPPMFTSGWESWTFRLAADCSRRPRLANLDAVREHFSKVDAAWRSARGETK